MPCSPSGYITMGCCNLVSPPSPSCLLLWLLTAAVVLVIGFVRHVCTFHTGPWRSSSSRSISNALFSPVLPWECTSHIVLTIHPYPITVCCSLICHLGIFFYYYFFYYKLQLLICCVYLISSFSSILDFSKPVLYSWFSKSSLLSFLPVINTLSSVTSLILCNKVRKSLFWHFEVFKSHPLEVHIKLISSCISVLRIFHHMFVYLCIYF